MHTPRPISSRQTSLLFLLCLGFVLTCSIPAQARAPLYAGEVYPVGAFRPVPVPLEVQDARIACNQQDRCVLLTHDATREFSSSNTLDYAVVDRTQPRRAIAVDTVTSHFQTPNAGREDTFAVALAGDVFLAAWCSDYGTVHARLIDTSTDEDSSEPVELHTDGLTDRSGRDCRDLDVTAIDGEFLVTWNHHHQTHDTWEHPRARWVGADGVPRAGLPHVFDPLQGIGLVDADFDGEKVVLLGQRREVDGTAAEFFITTADPATHTIEENAVEIPLPTGAVSPSQACSADLGCRFIWFEKTEFEETETGHRMMTARLGDDGLWSQPPTQVFSQAELASLDDGSFLGRTYIFAGDGGFVLVASGLTSAEDGEASVQAHARFVNADSTQEDAFTLDFGGSSAQSLKALAMDASGFRAVLTNAEGEMSEAFLSKTGELVERRAGVEYTRNDPNRVWYVSAGDETFLVWSEPAPTGSDTFATPLAADGRPLIEEGVQLDAPTATSWTTGCDGSPSAPIAWLDDEQRVSVAEARRCEDNLEVRRLAQSPADSALRVHSSRYNDISVTAYQVEGELSARVMLSRVGAEQPLNKHHAIDAYSGWLRGLACSEERCIIALENRINGRLTPTLISFVPSVQSAQFEVERAVEVTSSTMGIQKLEIGRAGSRIIASMLGWTASGDSIWNMAVIGDDLELEHRASYGTAGLDWVETDPPIELDGRRAAYVSYWFADDYGRWGEAGLVRMGTMWEWQDEEPIQPVYRGRTRPITSYAFAPGGGIYATFDGPVDPDAESQPAFYIQVIGTPAGAGEFCESDPDCDNGMCIDEACVPFYVPDGDAGSEADAGEGPSSDTSGQGGCQQAGHLPAGNFLPALLALLFIARRRPFARHRNSCDA